MLEVAIKEVSEIVGVSQSQLLKNFKRYIPKLNESNITYDGKGKNRKFYMVQDIYSNEQIAYDTFKMIAYNVWGFNRQTNIDKLLMYMCVILCLQELKTRESFCTKQAIAERVGVNSKTISKYKNILVNNQVLVTTNLEGYITIASYRYKEFPSYTSNLELIYSYYSDDGGNDIHKFKHNFKIDGVNVQQEQNEIVVDNSIWKTYIKSKRFDKFEAQLGMTKLYIIRKTQYTASFMKDYVLLDIICRSFLYKFSNEKDIIDMLEKYKKMYHEEAEILDNTEKAS